jgi:hypothetical protein
VYRRGESDRRALPCTDDRRSSSPVTCIVRLLSHSNEVGSKQVSNLKANSQGVFSGAWEIGVITVNKGRHTSRMGLNQMITRPNSGYHPTQGLISLFSKTGTGRRNPKPLPKLTTPQTTQLLHRRCS